MVLEFKSFIWFRVHHKEDKLLQQRQIFLHSVLLTVSWTNVRGIRVCSKISLYPFMNPTENSLVEDKTVQADSRNHLVLEKMLNDFTVQ